MTDEIVQNIEPVAPVEVAPVEVPVEAPVVTPEATPAPESAPVVDATPAPEAPTTIMGEIAQEIPPVVEVPAEQPDESNLTDDPAPLPEYEAFTVPEGFSLGDEALVNFNKDLAEFEVKSKATHAEVQAFGQKIIDKYVTEMTQLQDSYKARTSEIQKSWKEAFEKDPELGGNRVETTKKIIANALNDFSGTPEQRNALTSFVEKTGIGNNADIMRLIVNQQKAIENLKSKYESEDSVVPILGTKPDLTKLKPAQKFYGTSN